MTDYQIHYLGNPSGLPENLLKIHPCLSNYRPIPDTVAFTFHKRQPRMDSKRNRLETKPARRVSSKSITNTAYCLFAPSAKRFSCNRIYSKYHNHASPDSLQTVCCRFIYLHEENANAADTDNQSRLPGWAGNFRWQQKLNSQSAP